MTSTEDIYKYDLKLERKLESIQKSPNISKSNKKKILDFQKHCIAQGLSKARALRYLHDLPKLAEYLGKDFKKATKHDFENVLNKIESLNYAPQTILDFKKTIKKFYKWLYGGEEYPKSINWIKTSRKKNNTKLPEELLSEDDIKLMIQTATHPRDRAIISVLWESGCRAGELLTMEVKSIVFEESITRAILNGKTGPRRVPLLDSTPYISDWLNNHPFRDDPSSPLWLGVGSVGINKLMSYAALRKMLAVVAKKANIKCNVNPHNFRHSRATFLANHLTEAQMNQYLGWVRGSDMPATYVHLSGRDVDEAILKMRGMKPKKEKIESTLAPKNCPRCSMINKATSKFCMRCGSVLDLETAVVLQDEIKNVDEKLSTLLQDEDVQKLLVKKMIQLGIK
jgi:integrase